jgi:hypothetical protein
MANRLFSPNQQYSDTTGLPYAGGSLTFYASGTSTPLATYSNRALSIANTNPVVLDSAGRAGDIFLQNLAYKVVLCSDALGLVPVWTADPVYSSDFSTTASFLSGAGSPNGVVAGSAGSPTVPASVYWDTTNNILYVATTTGTSSTTVWTAVNASTAAAVVPAPQGYLTPTTGVPIISGDVTAATSVFYTPYTGNLVPIYNGTTFVPTVFTELTLTLNAAHAASNIYDVFVFNNTGVPTIVTGPSWSAGSGGNIASGTCARGTGAGGAALSRINGILTNTVQITGRNGATTYTINANLATYLGSIFMDTTNGQVTCHRSWGVSRKWGIWNAYNRVPIVLQMGLATASWTFVGGFEQSNGSATAVLTMFTGLAEEFSETTFFQNVTVASGASVQIGISFTSGIPSLSFSPSVSVGTATTLAQGISAYLGSPPILGIVNVLSEEQSAGGSSTFFGGNRASMILKSTWRG